MSSLHDAGVAWVHFDDSPPRSLHEGTISPVSSKSSPSDVRRDQMLEASRGTRRRISGGGSEQKEKIVPELAFLGSVGTLVETFATTLDDFIGSALEEWNAQSPGEFDKQREISHGSTESMRRRNCDDPEVLAADDVDGIWHEVTRPHDQNDSRKEKPTRSWNDFSFDENDDTDGKGVWISTNAIGDDMSSQAKVDILDQRKEHIRHVMEKNPVDRYKKHNSWLKSKVLSLQKQLKAMEEAGVSGTMEKHSFAVLPCQDSRLNPPANDLEEEHATLQMQIEQLLSQKSKLVYENDSLKRENARLNELIDYFFASSSVNSPEDDV